MKPKPDRQFLDSFIEELDKQDEKIAKLIKMYLGLMRNGKPYSIRELSLYWDVDEETIRDIIIEIMPKLYT